TPKVAFPGEESETRRWMKRKGIDAVPVVDKDRRVLRILFRDENAVKSRANLNLPVVINAGGKGTRLYPYTKILPKPLIPVGDMPIAEIIIDRFVQMGCNQFYMIVNHKKNMIKAYFNEVEKKDYTLTFLDEEKPLGTGGGLAFLKGMLDDTFVFINCDTVIEDDFESILKTHRTNGNLVTMITAVKRFDVPYGVVETGENGSICAFREKPQLSYLVNTGCYIVEPEVIDTLVPDEPIGFPTVIERIKQSGKKVGIYPVSQEAWLDMGQFDTMEDMRRRLGLDD
ncbi:MAG: NTP transferase domain-containing protein, partial [Clostridia bacterium]|nr:NTP transferase domain-containing protein [Clostridia bacterium]